MRMKLTPSAVLIAAFAIPGVGHAAESFGLRSFMTDEVLNESLVEDDAVTPVDYRLVSCNGCGDSACCEPSCGCDDACGCGDVCCGSICGDGCAEPCVLVSTLLGCFGESDRCFDDWISPMTNPVFFEDPRTLTELRGIFLQHKVPSTAGGGDVQLYALQIRAALTDRLSLIATKDGYAVSDNPLIADGWADLALGLKYNLVRDTCTQTLLSAGAVYELPVGSTRTLQGNGDGEFHLFLTGGTELCCDWHLISALGLRLPADDDAESTSMYWSNHVDYHLGRGVYALAEFNWYHWLESGAGGVAGVSGGDLFNFGSTGIAGNDIVTGAFGVKYKPNRYYEIGLAWENPLTQRRDVLENRLTADLILRY